MVQTLAMIISGGGFSVMVLAYHEKGGLFGWISVAGAAYSGRH
jgi:hypothetical protein